MNAKKKLKGEAFLGFGGKQNEEKINLNLSKDSNLNEAAYNLFDYLIKLDKLNMRKIAISPIPDIGLGKVINDKLKRASKKMNEQLTYLIQSLDHNEYSYEPEVISNHSIDWRKKF